MPQKPGLVHRVFAPNRRCKAHRRLLLDCYTCLDPRDREIVQDVIIQRWLWRRSPKPTRGITWRQAPIWQEHYTDVIRCLMKISYTERRAHVDAA